MQMSVSKAFLHFISLAKLRHSEDFPEWYQNMLLAQEIITLQTVCDIYKRCHEQNDIVNSYWGSVSLNRTQTSVVSFLIQRDEILSFNFIILGMSIL